MVINQQMATVPESDCIRTAIAVGQIYEGDWTPRPTVVLRPCFKQVTLLGASQGLKSITGMHQDARLDGVNRSAVVDRPDTLPAFATIHGPFKMNLPRMPEWRAKLGAAWAEYRAVIEKHWFILDRPEKAVWQPLGFRPSGSIIRGTFDVCPALTCLVKEQQRAVWHLEQNRVRTMHARVLGFGSVRDFDRSIPTTFDLAR